MRRREFIISFGGAVAAWPLVARAQQGERTRRVGVLLPATADDAHYQTWLGAFLQGMAQSGWNIGQNVRIDTRWATAGADAVRRNAAELVALAPDVIFAPGASTVGPLLQMTHTVPIIFAVVADPVGAGFVDSLARPGRNATGFMAFEYGIQREVARTPQADRAKLDASGGASRCRHTHRYRPVRCYPGHGSAAQGRHNSGQLTRRRRDRARDFCLRGTPRMGV